MVRIDYRARDEMVFGMVIAGEFRVPYHMT